MKKLWLPLLYNSETFVSNQTGGSFMPGSEVYKAFTDKGKAREFAKTLAMGNVNGKVILFEAVMVVEPRRVEFAEKSYNEGGELVV